MSYLEILLLAIALSVDACVVSFTYGISDLQYPKRDKFSLGIVTGCFQCLMPIIGYYLTNMVMVYISPFAKYIIFLIFTYLGSKFIQEAFEEKKDKLICLDFFHLLLAGIATSIDAFSAGISLMLSGNHIIKPAILIGVVTFINSNVGFTVGERIKNMPIKNIEILSGIILISLGIKSLF